MLQDSYYIELFKNEFVKTLGQTTGFSVSILAILPIYMYFNNIGFFSKKGKNSPPPRND